MHACGLTLRLSLSAGKRVVVDRAPSKKSHQMSINRYKNHKTGTVWAASVCKHRRRSYYRRCVDSRHLSEWGYRAWLCASTNFIAKYLSRFFVVSVTQHAKRMTPVACLALQYISTYLINGTIFEKRRLLNSKCEFRFFFYICPKYFSF
jgi:hypothetical protein